MTNLEQQLKFKHGRIFKATTPLSHLTIYFKLIGKSQYDRYMGIVGNSEQKISVPAEDYLFNAAVIYPEKFFIEQCLLAGEYHAIAEAIASNSGWHNLEDFSSVLKGKRILSTTLIEQMIAFISKAFPVYKIEELEALNYEELARMLALAENILEARLNVPGAEVEEVKQQNSMLETERQAIAEQTRARARDALKASRRS